MGGVRQQFETRSKVQVPKPNANVTISNRETFAAYVSVERLLKGKWCQRRAVACSGSEANAVTLLVLDPSNDQVIHVVTEMDGPRAGARLN